MFAVDERIRFDGAELIGSGTSAKPNRSRWTESDLFVFRDPTLYVLQRVGRSKNEGERDIFSLHVFDNARDLIRGCRRYAIRYERFGEKLDTPLETCAIDGPDYAALDDASDLDNDIADALNAYDEQIERNAA